MLCIFYFFFTSINFRQCTANIMSIISTATITTDRLDAAQIRSPFPPGLPNSGRSPPSDAWPPASPPDAYAARPPPRPNGGQTRGRSSSASRQCRQQQEDRTPTYSGRPPEGSCGARKKKSKSSLTIRLKETAGNTFSFILL